MQIWKQKPVSFSLTRHDVIWFCCCDVCTVLMSWSWLSSCSMVCLMTWLRSSAALCSAVLCFKRNLSDIRDSVNSSPDHFACSRSVTDGISIQCVQHWKILLREFHRVPTPPGKSWIFFLKIPEPGKSWKISLDLESPESLRSWKVL